jgi:hypothetical protein
MDSSSRINQVRPGVSDVKHTPILADTIGFGGDNNFGGRQQLMTAVGIVVILAGVGLHFYGDKFFNQDGGEDESTE